MTKCDDFHDRDKSTWEPDRFQTNSSGNKVDPRDAEIARLKAELEALKPRPVVKVVTFHILTKPLINCGGAVEYYAIESALDCGKLACTFHDGVLVGAEVLKCDK